MDIGHRVACRGDIALQVKRVYAIHGLDLPEKYSSSHHADLRWMTVGRRIPVKRASAHSAAS